MKTLFTFGFLSFLILSTYQNCFSTHLLGGELNYTLIDSSTLTYEFELRIYRDCANAQGPFDPSISIFIFEQGSSQFQTLTIARDSTFSLPLIADSSLLCSLSPYYFCLESSRYKAQISLASSSLGYEIGWARCCLSNAFLNIMNPLGEGLTYLNTIPPNDSTYNSSPLPYDELYDIRCSGSSFSFDFSTTDPDGDSLVYVLSEIDGGLNTQGLGVGNPMQGGNDPTVDPFNNMMGPSPYIPLAYLNSYSAQNPINAPAFQLDPESGILSGNNANVGIYLIGIRIEEYRDGSLISSSRRYFPLSFSNCLNSGLEASLDFRGQETIINGIPVLDYQDSMLICIGLQANSPDSNDVVRIFQRNFSPGIRINPSSGSAPFQADICWRYDSMGLADTCFLVELIVGSDIFCPNTERFEFSFAVCYDSARTALRIEKQIAEIPISLYPNPGRDYLEVELPIEFYSKPVSIGFRSLNGQLEFLQAFPLHSNKYRLDTSHLTAGIYFLEVSSSRGRSIRKWIKE